MNDRTKDLQGIPDAMLTPAQKELAKAQRTSNLVVELKAWMATEAGRKFACVRNYPFLDKKHDAHCEGCLIVASLKALESLPVETTVPLSGFMSDGRNGIVPDPNYRTRFKVGERILSEGSLYRYYPRATVTEITARGFKYRYDERINLGPRHGWYQEGESFTDHGWDLAADQSPCSPVEPARELSASEAASFAKTLARSPRRVPLRDSDAAFNLGVLPTEQPEKATERPCSKCRAVNLHDLDNCANCGSPLNGTGDAT